MKYVPKLRKKNRFIEEKLDTKIKKYIYIFESSSSINSLKNVFGC